MKLHGMIVGFAFIPYFVLEAYQVKPASNLPPLLGSPLSRLTLTHVRTRCCCCPKLELPLINLGSLNITYIWTTMVQVRCLTLAQEQLSSRAYLHC